MRSKLLFLVLCGWLGGPAFCFAATPVSPVGTWQIEFRTTAVSPTYMTFKEDYTMTGYSGPDPSLIEGTWGFDAKGKLVTQFKMTRSDGSGPTFDVTMTTTIGKTGRMGGSARVSNGFKGRIAGVRTTPVPDISGTWHTGFNTEHGKFSLPLSYASRPDWPGMYEITCESQPDLFGRAILLSNGWFMFYVFGDVYPAMEVTLASGQGKIIFTRMKANLKGEIESGYGRRLRVQMYR